jgi:hypothetical protein
MSPSPRRNLPTSAQPAYAVRPITPKEAAEQQLATLPPEVITCWNGLIAKALRNGAATIQQEDALQALSEAMGLKGSQHQRIFDNGWLDIEPLFRANGWAVKYDKPTYDESRDAFWVFTQKRSRGGMSR